MAAFVLGGTNGGAGKSVVAAAIASAFRDRGLEVRSVTIGAAFTRPPTSSAGGAGAPDSGAAFGCSGSSALPSGPACVDLMLVPDADAAIACFQRASEGSDVCIVDGCLALLDGAPPARGAPELCGGCGVGAAGCGAGCGGGGGRSTAEVARALGLPIVLVVDAGALRGAASVAALLQGYSAFDGGLKISGLVLNRTAGEEQVQEMRAGLAAAGVKVPIVGSLAFLLGDGRDSSPLRMRPGEFPWPAGSSGSGNAGGLGAALLGAASDAVQQRRLEQLAGLARRHLSVDLDLLLDIGRQARVPAPEAPLPPPARSFRVAIGVAYDQAFNEYFQQNLSLLAAAGAQLVPFSPLSDTQLPAGVSALLFGGGQPDQWAARLASNSSMLAALQAFAAAGGIVAGEGAGIMYLAETLQTAPMQRHAMAGLLPFHALVLPRDHWSGGYVGVTVVGACPFLSQGTQLRGYFQRCCEVVVVEQRVVQGLGAPCASAGSGSSSAAAGTSACGASPREAQASPGSDASGGAPLGTAACGGNGGALYSHCFEARMNGADGGTDGVPEGYTAGTVLGSSVHLFYGSCPAAATQIVQSCLRVDIAATSAAAARAARVALAAAHASATAALCDALVSAPPAARKGAEAQSPSRLRRSPPSSACSDVAQSSPSAGRLTPPPSSALSWRRAGAKSTPDLMGLSHEAGAFSQDVSGDMLSYWQQGPFPQQRQHPQRPDTAGSSASTQQSQLYGAPGEWQPRHLKSLKSMSIPANMHRMAAEAMHQQQQQQAQPGGGSGGGPLPFAVPKRWSLELQRLGSHLSHLSGGGARQEARSTPRGVHRRNGSHGSHGSYGRLAAALESDLEPLPEAAARALAASLPVTGRTHSKMIGLACPLGDGGSGGLPPLPLLSRANASSSSFGSLTGLGQYQQHQQQQHLATSTAPSQQQHHSVHWQGDERQQQQLQQQQQPPPADGAGPSEHDHQSSERVSDGSSTVAAPSPQAAADGVQHYYMHHHHHQHLQQQQQQQFSHLHFHHQQHTGNGLLPGVTVPSGPSISRRSSATSLELPHHHPYPHHPHHQHHHGHQNGGASTPTMSRVGSAPNAANWGLLPNGAGAGAALHRRNASASCCSLPARPGRGNGVVSLSPSATATLVALGLGPRLAGVTAECRAAPRERGGAGAAGAPGGACACGAPGGPEVVCYAVRPSSGGGGRPYHKIDADAIRRMRPALVVVPSSDGDCQEEDGSGKTRGGSGSGSGAGGAGPWYGVPDRAVVQKALERSGVLWPESGAVVLYQKCFTLSEVLEFVVVLSSAASVPEQGAMLCERLRARLRRVAAARAAAATGPRLAPASPDGPGQSQPLRVAVLCCLEAGALALAGLWVPEMLQLAGAAPVPGAPAPGEPHQRVDWPALQRAAPQALVVCSPGEGAGGAAARAGALAALPGWWALPAVRAGRVYVLDCALALEPGVELVEGVELLAHLLQPRAHPAPAAARPGTGAEAPRALRLSLHGGQRCRPRLLPNFFVPLY